MNRYVVLFAVASVVVIVLWGANWAYVPHHYPTVQDDGTPATRPIGNPGIFGDMFGGINSLFAGLSAAGVIVTLLLQARQLKDQAEEQARSRVAQDRLMKTQEGLTNFTAAQAAALTEMVQQQKNQNRRNALEYLLRFNSEEIVKQDIVWRRTYTVGNPAEKAAHDNAGARIANLKAQNGQIEAELRQLLS